MNFKINRFINCKLVRNLSVNTSNHQRKNYYDSLGITPKATQGDVKTAYYNLSKLYHPDLNKGNLEASEKFKDITAAYEVLGNVKTRKMYDRGILVGALEQTYESTDESIDPKNETFEHARFYHHRNKPTKKSKKVNPEHYDLDAWTKAHYSTTLQEAHLKKREEQQYRADIKDQETFTNSSWQIVSLILFLSAFGLFQGTLKDINHDKSHVIDSLQKNEKP